MEPRIVEAAGSRFQIGYTIGRACADLIHQDIHQDGPEAFKKETLVKTLHKHWAFTKDKYPEIAEELLGIAKGAQVDFWPFFASIVEELWDFNAVAKRGCTDVAVTTPSIEPSIPLLVGHNNDSEPDEWPPEKVVLVYTSPNDAPESLAVTFSGTSVLCGINSAGVVLGGNQLTAKDTRPWGVPRLILSRAVLDAKDFLMAVWTVMDDSRSSSYNNIIGFRDGNVVSLEGSATKTEGFKPSEDGLIYHSNHYIHSDMIEFEARPDDQMGNSINRVQQAKKRLQEKGSGIGVLDIMDILRDHVGYPESICRHEKEVSTIFSVVMRPDNGKIWLAMGNPCCNQYSKYSL